MIIPIGFKTPDAVWYALLENEHSEEYQRKLKKWIEYGERVTLLFDTEANTLTVEEV